MPPPATFNHLPLLQTSRGPARPRRAVGKPSPQTTANKRARRAHSQVLASAATELKENWERREARKQDAELPAIPPGVPILLQVDPSLDLDVLREKFDFEIVSEQEDGYVIVASEDIDLTPFLAMVRAFAVEIRGSTTIAQVHKLLPDDNDRLSRILSDHLLAEWPKLQDEISYVVDVGIACTGTIEIPAVPTRGKRDDDHTWAKKELAWAQARAEAYEAWDEIKRQRETEIEQFARAYDADILHLIDQGRFDAAVLPDSFTVRLSIVGKGLRDFILNYAYIFEVVEPDDIFLPPQETESVEHEGGASPTSPNDDAPAVCVIDSGIQENHILIEPAIDHATSYCFLPGRNKDDVGDFVSPGGHGTRVAGAVIYGEVVAKQGTPQLPFWIQNARVLDETNRMPQVLFPPTAVRGAVERFHNGSRNTRIFNHSINASSPSRTRHMSAWAAEIDLLCAAHDILLVQTVGNIQISGTTTLPGVQNHLTAGRDYPQYLYLPASRVANPGQSLQALTVGSIAYGPFEQGDWSTFAHQLDYPSAFSRSGYGIWGTIKPEVVEYGGDNVRTPAEPPLVQPGGQISAACPELVRSTVFPPGPLFDRDETGTSFAAPKVSRTAAALQAKLPDEPAILYRALIVQSARWPTWGEKILNELRQPNASLSKQRREKLLGQASRIIRLIGYGIPDEVRATSNSEHRTTLITSGEKRIVAGECHIYQVPIPAEIRRPADDYDIRIDVTLSYTAQPRRTRRNLRRYLSTWLDWKASGLGEGIEAFRLRALKDEAKPAKVPGLPWTINENVNAGYIRGVRRNAGTVQKDWAVVKSNALPEQFCVAVVGHMGWSHDPDSSAFYSLVVTFEILGQEIVIYEPLRAAVIELQAQLEAEAEVEVND